MKSFIIYVAGRIRNGQRVGLAEFPYSEAHGKYIYQGRELSLEEFNEAAPLVFNPNYRSNGYVFCPAVIVDDVVEQEVISSSTSAIVIEEVATIDPVIIEETPVIEPDESSEEPSLETSPRFTVVGSDIFEGETRVGGLFDPGNHLRVAPGMKDLRPEIEEFLKSQSQ